MDKRRNINNQNNSKASRHTFSYISNIVRWRGTSKWKSMGKNRKKSVIEPSMKLEMGERDQPSLSILQKESGYMKSHVLLQLSIFCQARSEQRNCV